MKELYFLVSIFLLMSLNTARSQTYGCTDPLATNYNTAATNNDGSCVYASASVVPVSSFNLSSYLIETSGLIFWNNTLWTHNDSGDTNVYALDTVNGNIIQSYPLSGVINNDWEEFSQDDNYIFIGDFGNNTNGNRTDLKILRIEKTSLLLNAPVIDTINFSYSDQTDFTPTGSYNTDYDCEAFIVSADSIYLFTKQWISKKTSVYVLPKTPGTYTANLKSTFDVQGLITGAVFLETERLIALSGYINGLNPFIYLLYDFTGTDFFSGNKRKVNIALQYHQVEGITTSNGLKYYISNEYFTQPPYITVPQKLQTVDLNSFLAGYLDTTLVNLSDTKTINNYSVYPVPACHFINIKKDNNFSQKEYIISNELGQMVLQGSLSKEFCTIDISGLSEGLFILTVGNETYKVIKKCDGK